MIAYLSVNVTKDRGRQEFSGKSALVIDGNTVCHRWRGGYKELPNTVLWAVLGPVNQEAKRHGLPGDIKPETLKPDVKRYRREWVHTGQGWTLITKAKEPPQ